MAIMEVSEAQEVLNKMSRSERKTAKRIRNNAADSMGLRNGEFMRLIEDGDDEALEELAIASAESDEVARWEFDPDKFGKFLEMIISFLKALMAIWGGFGFKRRGRR